MLDPTYRLLQGDVLARLAELPADSVHCVVTSPPYWGLRDYGTAEWDGGDAACDHKPSVSLRAGRGGNLEGGTRTVDEATLGTSAFKAGCPKCGAIRLDQQIGLEKTPAEYLAKLVAVFREVRRVLRSDGTCWINMGDSYMGGGRGGGAENSKQQTNSGSLDAAPNQRCDGWKPKDLCGMPWRLALALQDDGWYLRQDIIWAKPNPMPESVTDRCTKAHEYLFLLTKSAKYYYDAEAIKEPANGWNDSEFPDGKNLEVHPNVGKNRSHARGSGVNPKAIGALPGVKQNESFSAAVSQLVEKRNKRSVWEIATEAFPEAHFATFPTKLVEPCILAGTSEKGCCSACGAPTTRLIAPTTEYSKHLGAGKRMNGYDYEGDAANGMKVNSKVSASYETTGWKAGCKCGVALTGPTVLDPFNGSGTTGIVALANRCNYIGIELNSEYLAMAERRLSAATAQRNLL